MVQCKASVYTSRKSIDVDYDVKGLANSRANATTRP